ncbi:c-type cytochrome [uncultured Salipiger sp.]|uniref:c-type cytochrome n=1 Tax=uncultured Salipiger sp. TaxID=499810 RepID=UPI002595B8E0|nr:c-type cytochrome [uncultured Salipiger sp.]
MTGRLAGGLWPVAVLGAILAVAACARDEMPRASDGRALFLEYCSVCHGESARGDGEMARAMSTPPKDLTLIALRHGDSFPRAKVLSMIDGYARSDLDGPGMPEFGELLKGDLVPLDTGDGVMTPTPRKMVALLEYLESIQATR